MIYVGIDYSIHSPGICLLAGDTMHFASLPRETVAKPEFFELLEKYDINVDISNKLKNSSKMLLSSRESTIDSLLLASSVISKIKQMAGEYSEPEHNVFVIEGFSFNSRGNRLVQLAGYQFVLRNMLILAGLMTPDTINDNLWVFAPQTVKSTALKGCKDRDGKEPMIKKFIEESLESKMLIGLSEHPFWLEMKNKPGQFQDKKGLFIKPIDDIVDAYFVLKTYFNVVTDMDLLKHYTTETQSKPKDPNKPKIKRRKAPRIRIRRKDNKSSVLAQNNNIC